MTARRLREGFARLDAMGRIGWALLTSALLVLGVVWVGTGALASSDDAELGEVVVMTPPPTNPSPSSTPPSPSSAGPTSGSPSPRTTAPSHTASPTPAPSSSGALRVPVPSQCPAGADDDDDDDADDIDDRCDD